MKNEKNFWNENFHTTTQKIFLWSYYYFMSYLYPPNMVTHLINY
jgi:hypothetical protein